MSSANDLACDIDEAIADARRAHSIRVGLLEAVYRAALVWDETPLDEATHHAAADAAHAALETAVRALKRFDSEVK